MRLIRSRALKVRFSDKELRELRALARYEHETLAQTIRIALRERFAGLVVKSKAA